MGGLRRAVAILVLSCAACCGTSGAPTGPSPPALFQAIGPGPSDLLTSGQAGFKVFIEAAPRCRLGPPPPCGAPDHPVSADLVFTRPGSSGSPYRIHSESDRVFTIELPPGRYTVRIAHPVAYDVPGLRVQCPQRRMARAVSGAYVHLSITCAYPT